jgi:hypothetical protein
MKHSYKARFVLFVLLVFSGISLNAQTLDIQIVELSLKRPDINRQYEETELVISFRNIGREFLKVKSFEFTLTDDQGTNLIQKGDENLKAYEKQGFFTSRSLDWEFFGYGFYNQKNGFGGRFITYSAPSKEATQLLLKGEAQVWVSGKSNKPREISMNGISVNTHETYTLDGGGIVRFVEKGVLTLDNIQFKNYKVESDVPVLSVAIAGQRRFQGIPNPPDEIFVSEAQKEISLVFQVPDAQIMTIPVDLKFGIGMQNQ